METAGIQAEARLAHALWIRKPSLSNAIVEGQLRAAPVHEAAGGRWLRADERVARYSRRKRAKPSFSNALFKWQIGAASVPEAAGTATLWGRADGRGAVRPWALRLAPALDTELRLELVTKLTRKAARLGTGADHVGAVGPRPERLAA